MAKRILLIGWFDDFLPGLRFFLRQGNLKTSALGMGLVVLLLVMLAAGTIFAQTRGPSPDCGWKVEEGEKSGSVQYVLKGPGCAAIVANIKQQPEQKGKGADGKSCRGKCVCTLETGSDIWICRGCCTERQLRPW